MINLFVDSTCPKDASARSAFVGPHGLTAAHFGCTSAGAGESTSSVWSFKVEAPMVMGMNLFGARQIGQSHGDGVKDGHTGMLAFVALAFGRQFPGEFRKA